MTAYQIPTENEQLIQWSNVELQQQHPSDCSSKKRMRTDELDESDDSATPPEKTLRLHESIAADGKLYCADQWIRLVNTSPALVLKEHDEQDSGKVIDISKLSTKEILLAYKRIWNNLDLSKPTDAKLEPFVWQQIRQYQQRL